MSVSFYSDGVETINRQIPTDEKANFKNGMPAINLELERCVKWIIDNNFSKIALQFPDNLLDAAVSIAHQISDQTQKISFILADTSYGSCCVDEVTAAHVKADCLIHFGHACLSVTQRLPVLYIFGRSYIEVPHVVTAFLECFHDTTTPVIIYYEVTYRHAISRISDNLKEYKNLVISEVVIPNEECKANVNEDQVKIVKNQRYFILPKTRNLEEYSIFYIGSRIETINNVMLCLSKCKFYVYNTVEQTVYDDTCSISRFMRQRYYYVERTKDARIIGILVGTLGVSNYVSTIKQLREAIAAAKKKSYVIVIGKRNVAKLANFVDIQIFVNVACLESTVVDCSGFYQPIITPYELEIALNIRQWTGDYITDFAELLPDGAHHVPVSNMKPETDVSLITGKTRSVGLSDTSDEIKDESAALVQRDEMAISEIHQQAAGEFLSQRSWKGLEQSLGETPAAEIQQGRKGIAAEYEDEKTEEN